MAAPNVGSQHKKQPQFTVFVRLPIPRNGFVDPPPVRWDALKDKALWNTISKASDTRDLDWQDIATRLDVSLDFLMQQAAWLYEKHFAGVRKQMQRLATAHTPSPVPQGTAQGSLDGTHSENGSLQRAGSKSLRGPSALAGKRLSITPIPDTVNSPTSPRPVAPPFSRTPSTATITQSRLFTSAKATPVRTQRVEPNAGKPQSPSTRPGVQVAHEEELSPERSQGHDESDSDYEPAMAQSQAIRRQPFESRPALRSLSSEGDDEQDEEDEDEETLSAGFLPFARSKGQDAKSTAVNRPSRDVTNKRPAARPGLSQQTRSSSTSSAGSTQPLDSASNKSSQPSQRPGALSPKHRSQLTRLSSPQYSQQRDGSEGTPSMGSSFSDLDDAGISSSAIEDAVLSQMQAGGGSIASRVSGLSQAFRSQK